MLVWRDSSTGEKLFHDKQKLFFFSAASKQKNNLESETFFFFRKSLKAKPTLEHFTHKKDYNTFRGYVRRKKLA